MSAAAVRRCVPGDWADVRRLQVKLALVVPVVVDVELNDVLATPDRYWQDFVASCAAGGDQALFVAEGAARLAGMGHVAHQGPVARLSALYVDGGARHRGTGTVLVEAQREWAVAAGASELVCHVPESSGAGELLERLGWQRTAELFYTRHGFAERRWVLGATERST